MSESIAEYLNLRIQEAHARLQAVNRVVKHSTSKGDVGEDVLRDVVSDFLPAACHVSKGFVVDLQRSGLKQSGQVDVLVYERTESVPLYHDKNLVVVTADMARLAIESKTVLNRTQLKEAIANAQSVKRVSNSTTAAIWAFGGMTIDTMRKNLPELLEGIPHDEWPNHFYNLQRGYVISRAESAPTEANGKKWTAFHGRPFVASSFFQTVLFAARVQNLTPLISSIQPQHSSSF